jgi:hypothetical protein
MKLGKMGRNKHFKFEQKFYSNPNCCTLHVSGKVTSDMISTLTIPEKRESVIQDLIEIKGIKKITPQPYDVMIEKEDTCDWQEILPAAERVAIQHLAKK